MDLILVVWAKVLVWNNMLVIAERKNMSENQNCLLPPGTGGGEQINFDLSSNLPLVLFISFFYPQLRKSGRVMDLLWEDDCEISFIWLIGMLSTIICRKMDLGSLTRNYANCYVPGEVQACGKPLLFESRQWLAYCENSLFSWDKSLEMEMKAVE